MFLTLLNFKVMYPKYVLTIKTHVNFVPFCAWE